MNKKELHNLYFIQGKTLQEIGDIFKLSRERIRQIMESFNFKCRKRGTLLGVSKPRKSNLPSLKDYFAYVQSGGKESKYTLVKLMAPFIKQCFDCHSSKNLHLHHLKYPATSILDLQVLCASCHFYKHRSGNGYKIQLKICDKYIKGTSGFELAREYKVNPASIYSILHKWNIQVRNYKLKSRQDKTIKAKKIDNLLFPFPTISCLRCHHTWLPRKPDIRVCPSCKSPYWNREYVRRRKC